MKKFFNLLLSDSNKISTKRFIGLLCLIMFIAYGVAGIVKQFNANFWIFYVSLCAVTMWIAFKFMTADKILKYDVIGKLSKFTPIKDAVESAIDTENQLDGGIQPDMNGTTGTTNTTTTSTDGKKKPEDPGDEDISWIGQ